MKLEELTPEAKDLRAKISKNLAAVYLLVTERDLSVDALTMLVEDLVVYPLPDVLRALDRCRRELKGFMSPSDVLERIESADGRPGPEEAWAMAIVGYDETETIVQTEEMAQAYSVARPLVMVNDRVAARKAFIETYQRLVNQARQQQRPIHWSASIGTDKSKRGVVLQAAIECGRLSMDKVVHLLPAPTNQSVVCDKILRLATSNGEVVDRYERIEKAKKEISKIRAMLDGKRVSEEDEKLAVTLPHDEFAAK